MIKVLKHLNTVRKHRKYVRRNCFAAGIYWQGLTHDLSKYSPTELFESIKYYQGTSSPINAAKKDKGYSDAWFHHKGRNKHHYEYWMDNFNKGTENILMPKKYFVELVCDYLGAAEAYSPSTFTFKSEHLWWVDNKSKHQAMNPKIQRMLDIIFWDLRHEEERNGRKGVYKLLRRKYIQKVYEANK